MFEVIYSFKSFMASLCDNTCSFSIIQTLGYEQAGRSGGVAYRHRAKMSADSDSNSAFSHFSVLELKACCH